MGFRKSFRIALFTAVASAALGMSMVTPASADPNWQPYTLTGKWHCAHVDTNPASALSAAICIIVNGNSTQAAVIASNNLGHPVTIAAPHVELLANGALVYDRYCVASTLNTGYSRACLAPTLSYPCSSYVAAVGQVLVHDGVSGVDWSFSAETTARKMCS